MGGAPRHALLALALALSLNAAAAFKVPATAQDLTLYRIWDDAAVCNDGTPSGLYYLPANDTAKSDMWLIYLEGGQWCYNNVTCYARAQGAATLASSKAWDKATRLSGIFDSDPKRNPWAGAHLVYLPYCSSDAWVGNAGPESNDWGFSFRGQRILEAALHQLQEGVNVTTLNVERFANHTHADVTETSTYYLTSSSKVLFGGCSAGSRGAMFSLDYVQAMLPAGAPPVLGFLDSPMWVDLEPLYPDIMSLENETQAIFNLVNATGRLGAACAAAYPGAEGWRCLYGQYRLPYVQTPYLISFSQSDRFQLPYNEGGNGGGYPPYTGANLTYADMFQAAVREVALQLPTAAQPRSAVFSSACFTHCTSTLSYGAFWGLKVNGLSLKDYLAAWYFGSLDWTQWTSANAGAAALPGGLSKQRIDACNGFACGQCHKKTGVPAPPLPPAYSQSLLAGAAPLGFSAAATTPSALARARADSKKKPQRKHKSEALKDTALFVIFAGIGLVFTSRLRTGATRARASPSGGLEMPEQGEVAPLLAAKA